VRDGNQPIAAVSWLAGPAHGDPALLLALHPPNHLVLWNMDSGTKVWKKSYDDTLLGIDLDPFTAGSALLRCATSFLFLHDLHPSKAPRSEGRKFYVTGGKGGSPGREAGEPSQEARPRGARLRRMVRSIVLGGEGGQAGPAQPNDCTTALFHRALPAAVLLAYPKEVLLVDTELGQTIGVIGLERSHSPLAALAVASQRELLLLLHESGSVSAWAPRPGLAPQAVTPAPGPPPRSQSLSSFPGPASVSAPPGEVVLEVQYSSVASSDHVRLGKNCKVLGLALNPVSQMEVAFLTTDGRVLLLAVRGAPPPGGPQALLPRLAGLPACLPPLGLGVGAILPGLASPPHTIRMCPPLTVKNWADYRPLVRSSSHLVRSVAPTPE
jgi:hypothetical protein